MKALKGIVDDYMIKKVLTIKPEDSVLAALRIIITGRDQLPVIDDDRRLVGMITWQDIYKKVILREKDPQIVKVEQVMRTSTTTLSRTDSIKDALNILAKEKFALPVLEDKKLVGLLSFIDVLRFYVERV